ncbi:MAG: hypothetical protein EXS16_08675, partial [Gemmataceae bacterium]|nr:hypothetical protein [Gemmataceae bacterium]
MRTFLLNIVLATLFASPTVHAQTTSEFLRTNPKFLAAFSEVTAKFAPSTVRVQADGKDTYLGVIISSDGWILTKAHELRGKITCVLHDGQKLDAKLIGVHELNDLAMLKVAARSLSPITFTSSNVIKPGAWVASVGQAKEPVAVGVVGTAARKVYEAYLGVLVETTPRGLTVLNIAPKSAAFKAGLTPKDILLQIDKRKLANPDELM